MRRRARFGLVLAALSAALTLAAPSPAPAVKCQEPLGIDPCAVICRFGQKLGFECLMNASFENLAR